MPSAGDTLLVRAADLVILGVRWDGMDVVAGPESEPPALVAGASGARLTVTLPPQHIAEQTYPGAAGGPADPGAPGTAITAPPGSPVTGIGTGRDSLRLFVVADDGRAYVNAWDAHWDPGTLRHSPRWEGWQSLGDTSFAPGTRIAAVSPDGVAIRLFAVRPDGALATCGWASEAGWSSWAAAPTGGSVAPGSELTAVAWRGKASVFAIANPPVIVDDSTAYEDPWWTRLLAWTEPGGPARVPGRMFAPGSRLAATVASFADYSPNGAGLVEQLFLAGVDADGKVTCDGTLDATNWTAYELGAPEPGVPPFAAVAVVGGAHGELDVLVVAADGGLWGMRLRWPDGPETVWPWRRLADGFIPGGHVGGALRDTTPFFHAVDAGGAVFAGQLYSEDGGPVLSAERSEGWFVPGSYTEPFVRGSGSDAGIEVFAVGPARTVGSAATTSLPPTSLLAHASLSGPSRLVFDVAEGTRVTLTCEGVLRALRDGQPTGETAIELPWGVFLAPDPRTTYLRHVELPRTASAIVELWHSELGSQPDGAGDEAGPSLLRPVRVREHDPPPLHEGHNEPRFVPPLDEQQRRVILDSATATGEPVRVDRAILSSLGGWLRAGGTWPAIDWQHDAAMGRDLSVRTVRRGHLVPFGHEAEYEEQTVRVVAGVGARSEAILLKCGVLRILDPVRDFDEGGSAFRAFPFARVEIVARTFADLDPPVWQALDAGAPEVFFAPARGGPLRFPVRLHGPAGAVPADVPLWFVADSAFADPVALRRLGEAFPGFDVDLPAARVAFGGEDFEVHGLTLGVEPDEPLRPRIRGARVGLPALRTFAPTGDAVHDVVLEQAYVDAGGSDVLFRLTGPGVSVDFGGRSDASGGLAVPAFVADALSGQGGPIKPGVLDPRQFFSGARLLGLIALSDVVPRDTFKPPFIRSEGLPPVTSMSWKGIELKGHGPFQTDGACLLDLEVTTSADAAVTTTGSLKNFKLDLAGVLVLRFAALTFTSTSDAKPSLKLDGPQVEFAGRLAFLDVLQEAIQEFTGEMPIAIDATPEGITVAQHAALPDFAIAAGPVSISVSGVALSTVLRLPFDGELGVDFSFGSRAHPFRVGVWILGGGGYLELGIAKAEGSDEFAVSRLAAAVEIGGVWSLDWVVVKGEVHALAGIAIALDEHGTVRLSGYVRVGGSVEVLGLVSVSIEVTAEISAEVTPASPTAPERLKVWAAATLALEVDLFLVSVPVHVEQEVVLYDKTGPDPADGRSDQLPAGAPAFSPDELRAAWGDYRAAFEPAT